MNLPQPLKRGQFLRRLNRFVAEVAVDGERVLAHVANSGRLRELLTAGAEVYLHSVDQPGRKTAYDLLLVRFGKRLVSVDSRAPARIAAEALLTQGISPVPAVEKLRQEVRLGAGRVDLWVRCKGDEWLIETKGCTLVEDGVALFPDAPTARGRRHVEELARRVASGRRAMVLFVVQRDDALLFRANLVADPEFARALAVAQKSGVAILAHACHVTTTEVRLARRLPVDLRGTR